MLAAQLAPSEKNNLAPPPFGVQGWERAPEGCGVDHMTVSTGSFPLPFKIAGCITLVVD